MMTKKDYVKFADMIAERKAINEKYHPEDCKLDCHISELDCISDRMIQLFESDNPNFDPRRFNNYIENKVKQILDSVQ